MIVKSEDGYLIEEKSRLFFCGNNLHLRFSSGYLKRLIYFTEV